MCSISLAENAEMDCESVLVVTESFITPRTVLEVSLADGSSTVVKRQPVLGDFDPARYTAHREWATAADGTQVPISVVRRADLAPDGVRPFPAS